MSSGTLPIAMTSPSSGIARQGFATSTSLMGARQTCSMSLRALSTLRQLKQPSLHSGASPAPLFSYPPCHVGIRTAPHQNSLWSLIHIPEFSTRLLAGSPCPCDQQNQARAERHRRVSAWQLPLPVREALFKILRGSFKAVARLRLVWTSRSRTSPSLSTDARDTFTGRQSRQPSHRGATEPSASAVAAAGCDRS